MKTGICQSFFVFMEADIVVGYPVVYNFQKSQKTPLLER